MKLLRRNRSVCRPWTLLLASLLAAPGVSQAASKALLMGTGEFEQVDILTPLPGIGIDVNIMQKLALDLGYETGNIKRLEGKQLTLANVRDAFEWLRTGMNPEDHALIYFSGHGYQTKDRNGDEEDGYDEILPLYRYSGDNNEYLLDDEFNRLIAKIPNARTHVFIDACCSGSSARTAGIDIGLDGATLVLKSPSCLTSSRGKTGVNASRQFTDEFLGSKGARWVPEGGEPLQPGESGTAVGSSRVMYLGAAQDDEGAMAGQNGSYFTRALHAGVDLYGVGISPAQLANHARWFLRGNLPDYRVHTPNLIGPSAYHEEFGYYLVPGSTSERNALRERVRREEEAQRLADEREGYSDSEQPPIQRNERVDIGHQRDELLQTSEIDIISPQKDAQVSLGDAISLDFELHHAGYVNVVTFDAQDNIRVLYPNAYQPDTVKFSAGFHNLPQGFGIQAAQPLGKTDIFVVYSPKELNWYTASLDGKVIDLGNPFPALTNGLQRTLVRERVQTTSAATSEQKLDIGGFRFWVCDNRGECE